MNNQKPIKNSFWDFRNVKAYITRGEKILDFWVGFLISGYIIDIFQSHLFSFKFEQLGQIGQKQLSFSISSLLPTLAPIFIVYGIIILGIFYFWKRRKYLA